MAKKQTRRSVSIRGATYETVRAYCEDQGVSMSEFMEQRIAGFFKGHMITRPHLERSLPSREQLERVIPPREQNIRSRNVAKLDSSELHDAARHFTF